jgi:hypothetical protein
MEERRRKAAEDLLGHFVILRPEYKDQEIEGGVLQRNGEIFQQSNLRISNGVAHGTVGYVPEIRRDGLVVVQTSFFFPRHRHGDYEAVDPLALTRFRVRLKPDAEEQDGSLQDPRYGLLGEIVGDTEDPDDEFFNVRAIATGKVSSYSLYDLQFKPVDVAKLERIAKKLVSLRLVSKRGFLPAQIPQNIEYEIIRRLTGSNEIGSIDTILQRIKNTLYGPSPPPSPPSPENYALEAGPLPYGPSEANFTGGARYHNDNNNWFNNNNINNNNEDNNNNNNNNNNQWQAQQNWEEWHQQMLNAQAEQWVSENIYPELNNNAENAYQSFLQENILRNVSKKGTVAHLPVPSNVQRKIHSILTGVPEAVGPSLKANNTRTIENVGRVYLQEKWTRPKGRPGAGIPNPRPVPMYQSGLNVGPLPYGPSEENFVGGRRKSRGKLGTTMARRGTRRSNGIFSRLYSPIGHLLSAGKESVGAVTNTAKGVVGEGIHGLDKIGRSVTRHANMAVKDVLRRKRKGGGTRKSRKSRRNTRRRR